MIKDNLEPLEQGYYDFLIALGYLNQAHNKLRRAYLRTLESKGLSFDQAVANDTQLQWLAEKDVIPD